VTSSVLSSEKERDVEVEDVAAELWAKQLGSGRGGAVGELVEVRRSSQRMMAGEMWSSGGVSGVSEARDGFVAT
jgi:hypothetical protein